MKMLSHDQKKMPPEDVALFRADPDYAATLGIQPRCVRCGGPIREVWGPWNGEPLSHAVKLACEWQEEGLLS